MIVVVCCTNGCDVSATTGCRATELLLQASATVADIAAALGWDTAGFWVDGHRHGGELSALAAGIVEGAVLSAQAPKTSERWPASGHALTIEAGPDSGAFVMLAPGVHRVGRADTSAIAVADPAVSMDQAAIAISDEAVFLTDLGSHNGTWVGGTALGTDPVRVLPGTRVRIGSSVLRVLPTLQTDRIVLGSSSPGSEHRVPLHRPPRRQPIATSVAALAPPVEPRARTAAAASTLLLSLLPGMGGLAMVAVTRNWLFGLTALLMPLAALGQWNAARRSNRRGSRQERTRYAAELEDFSAAIAVRVQREAVRREALCPGVAELCRRARHGSTSLWERRPGHPDAFVVSVGLADQVLRPLVVEPLGGLPGEVEATLQRQGHLPLSPVAISLLGAANGPNSSPVGAVIGIVGTRTHVAGLAAALLIQATVQHGPADLAAAVATAATSAEEARWSWAAWLPHTFSRDESGPLLASGPDVVALLARLKESSPVGPERRMLLVLDDPTLWQGRHAPAGELLRVRPDTLSILALAPRPEDLPASCSTVIVLDDDAIATVTKTEGGTNTEGVTAGVLSALLLPPGAARAARAMARYEDPELHDATADLPRTVRLADLLQLTGGETVAANWQAGGVHPCLAVPIGIGEDGVCTVDLAVDGPHALVAGTTGAGKSELLRSWVASLAATVDPRRLNFLLVDYKGGSAFDACARLPHTVGVITDLDGPLAGRALRSLKAEMKYREQLFHDADVKDLELYATKCPAGSPPLARLVVIIDEFATLVAELPEFVDGLVAVAQQGRSLGVHLVLATQRPQGAIKDSIRANTDLRIALRVADRADSTDVIGVPDAALLPREAPGRACIRCGQAKVRTVQIASTAAPETPAGEVSAATARPFDPFAPRKPSFEAAKTAQVPASTCTDLVRVLEACNAAVELLHIPPPRSPWLAPLPSRVDLANLISQSPDHPDRDVHYFFLVDDPDVQAQYPAGWDPAVGNLIIYGTLGSGTTTALVSLALAISSEHDSDAWQFYGVDQTAGGLDVLEPLPHCGGIIRLGDEERLRRVVGLFVSELNARRALSAQALAARPRMLLLVDGLPSLLSELDSPDLVGLGEAFQRVVVDGADVGLYVAASIDHAGALRQRLAASVGLRLVLRMSDPLDARLLYVDPVGADAPPGRGAVDGFGAAIQVAVAPDGPAAMVGTLVEKASALGVVAQRIERLPEGLPTKTLSSSVRLSSQPWYLPIGIGWTSLTTVGWPLHPDEHVMITGPPRSGRSTVLRTIATLAAGAAPNLRIAALSGRSPDPSLAQAVTAAGGQLLHSRQADLATALADVLASWHRGPPAPSLLLLDDADALGQLDDLLAEPLLAGSGVVLIAAGRADTIRSQYGWIRKVAQSRVGLLLMPDPILDGDLLGVRIPRRPEAPMLPGRGYLVSGGATELVQVARD